MTKPLKDPCYCSESPLDPTTKQRRFRCNWCWNGMVEDKNTLVRENQSLYVRLKGANEEGQGEVPV